MTDVYESDTGARGATEAASVRDATRSAAIPPFAWPVVAPIAALGAAALLFGASRYGYFGDELYFLAAGRRLSWGYADQGPMLPLLARTMDTLVPGSYPALRIPAVLITVVAIVLCAMITREFGGGRTAQALAAFAYACSPFLLLQGSMLTTNTVDTALWVLISWLVVRWVRTRRDGLLLIAGLVTAVDLQVKWLIPFFWIALAVSCAVFGPRELLRRPLLWAGAGLTVLSALPQVIWQMRHGWPQLAMGAEIASEQAIIGGRLLFVPISLILVGILGVPVLLGGLWALLRWKPLRPYRFLGATLIVVDIVFLVTGGRVYYPAGMYGVVLAAGAVALVHWLRARAAGGRRIAGVATAVIAVASVATIVTSLPWRPASAVEPPRDDVSAAIAIGTYGQFGWPELTAAVTTAYRGLPAARRDHAVVVTDTYWQASALDHLGRSDLPPVYSPSRGFGYFGTPPDSAETALIVGGDAADLRGRCTSLTPVGRVDTRLGFVGNTRDVTIFDCTGPKQPWSRMWPEWMHL
ncbi:ArnT family glycosyltransferase [Nocardia africana]|uniref:Predicted membrane protein n=1 Tax=Nocardia africana TaxID=134964 RepID=A0A378WWH3_9NOCA|nr:glycosyltransferase family 39 protein [Nocardia africana]MCC3313938.1 glycosyltransferase family 39 protein [Nocardia africana]SUA44673.1 Predicted membrane protein [Nocardia africana]